MLTIIAAAAEPVPGWPLKLPDDWFEDPRRLLLPRQRPPVDVLRAFRALLDETNHLYSSLNGTANRATAAELRSRARKLEAAAIAFDGAGAKRAFSADKFLERELSNCRTAIEQSEILKRAKRLHFLADRAEREKKVAKPLICLMPALVTCFQNIFGKKVARIWQTKSDRNGNEVTGVAGPFPPFASKFLQEVNCPYTPNAVHTDLGKWIKAKKQP